MNDDIKTIRERICNHHTREYEWEALAALDRLEATCADLLAALEDALTCVGNCEEHGAYADDTSRYDRVRTAIAKAKGE
jgi:hypothetical protein